MIPNELEASLAKLWAKLRDVRYEARRLEDVVVRLYPTKTGVLITNRKELFICPLCGQYIVDDKPCGCGAR